MACRRPSRLNRKSTSHNPRSTVGTVTEIYDYLRLLFARAGTPKCPDHDVTLEAQTVSQMVDHVLELPEGTRLMLLAPVVADRKGEHVQLMADLQAQGFIRARIDGEIYELDQPPALDLRKKHNIDAIVDRFKVKEDLRLRLAESFETALRLADGVARIAYMDDRRGRNHVLRPLRLQYLRLQPDRARAAPVFVQQPDRRLPELRRPRREAVLRSGARRRQPGPVTRRRRDSRLGSQDDLLLPNDPEPRVTLRFRYRDAVQRAVEKLQDIVLYGSGEDKIEFFYANSRGMQIKKLHRFEGVLPNLDRRYRETESSAVREELSKFLNSQACPDCGGTRLNEAARHVFICDHSLPEITSLSVGHVREFFDTMKLDGWRATIADKIVKEIVIASASSRTSGSTTCRSTAAPKRCRAVKRSAFGLPARSAPAWSASCTFSTSRRSACTSAIISACWARSHTCAISAIR